jgi:hypothetical protein
MLALLMVAPPARANGVPLANGDVLAATGNGVVKHFSPSGTLLDTLDTSTGATYTTGMCLDASDDLFVTDFSFGAISKFDSGGNLVASSWATSPDSLESCAFDTSAHMFVGGPSAAQVFEYDSTGAQTATFNVAADPTGTTGGTDWVALAAGGCSLFYTGEGSLIKRFNVCTNSQQADFASGLPSRCFELAIRPNGEVMVACAGEAVRLDSAGNILQTYTIPSSNTLFAMNLDPDNKSFWTGDIGNGEITHVDIATGTVLGQFNSSPGTQLAGLTIVGGIVVGGGPPPTEDRAIIGREVAPATTHDAKFCGAVATFTDPDSSAVPADYAATIDWGDGSPSSAGTITNSGDRTGRFAVFGCHRYGDAGTYYVKVTITDVDNPANTTTVTTRITRTARHRD